MNRLEAFHSIAEQAGRGDLMFPTNVNATLKLKKALDDPDAHLVDAAKLILTEPLLSARIVAMANSSAYNRSGMAITNVSTAVSRLGFRTIRSLTASLLVHQMSSSLTNPVLQAKAKQLWEHTVNVSALAQVIARRMTKVDPETAMFAGIVHEVGGFYLLSRADAFPGLLDGELEDWVEYGEKIIGRSVMKALEVPDIINAAIELIWQGGGTRPPTSLGDVLVLANDLSPVLSPLLPESEISSREVHSEIDFDIGNKTLRLILEDAEEETESLRSALLH